MYTDTSCTNCQVTHDPLVGHYPWLCPLHRAAPALLAALKAILSLQEQHDGESFEVVVLHAEQIAREAIAQVKPT